MEKRLPKKTDKIEIPYYSGITVEKKGKSMFDDAFKGSLKSFTFTAKSVPSDWMKPIAYIPEGSLPPLPTSAAALPHYYTPAERDRAELAELRAKTEEIRLQGFSTGKAYSLFGMKKFPAKARVTCTKCSERLEYVVDFFIHIILDHGNSLDRASTIFSDILNRIEKQI